MSSLTKLMKSMTRGSNELRSGATPTSIMRSLTKTEGKDYSENVSEDNGGHSFTDRMAAFAKSAVNR